MTTDHKLSDRATLQYFPGTSRPWQIVINGIEDRRNHTKQVAVSLTNDEMLEIYDAVGWSLIAKALKESKFEVTNENV